MNPSKFKKFYLLIHLAASLQPSSRGPCRYDKEKILKIYTTNFAVQFFDFFWEANKIYFANRYLLFKQRIRQAMIDSFNRSEVNLGNKRPLFFGCFGVKDNGMRISRISRQYFWWHTCKNQFFPDRSFTSNFFFFELLCFPS